MDLLSTYNIEIKADTGSVPLGDLYVAEDRRTGRLVTIGFFPESAVDKVGRRIEAQARLNHPALPTIYEFGETNEGTPYVVMQDLRGFSPIGEVDNPMSIDRILMVAIQLAALFSALEGQHVVHRDINPSNILLGPNGQIKVIDFGGESVSARSVELPSASPYLAPEQHALGMVDQRSAIFSFGATLYRLVTGRTPLIASELYDVERVLFLGPTARSDPRAHALDEIITECLHSDPRERYQSFDEIVHQLRSISIPLMPQAGYAPAAAAAQSIAISMRPEIVLVRGLQSLFADGRSAFASAAFLVSSLIAVIGLVSYSGTRIGFAMAFGGALLAYESLLLLSALIRDH